MTTRVVLFTVVFGALAALACSGPPPPPPAAPLAPPPGGATGVDASGTVRYLAIGDSLTQGIGAEDYEAAAFPVRLSARWKQKGCTVELKNAGIAGYTAAQIAQDQLPDVASFKPSLVTFQTGANDIANNVTAEDYRANVRLIITTAKKSGARVIVLFQNEWYRAPKGRAYLGTAGKRNDFDVIMLEEAKAAGAEVADLRWLYRQEADKDMWVTDGIHPTNSAYDDWAKELARIITVPCAK